MDLSIVKEGVFPPSHLTSVRGTMENPEKYYWAPSPISINPKQIGHICAIYEDKSEDPFSTDYVAFTCCPPSRLFEEVDPNPLRINPIYKPVPQPARKVCLETGAKRDSVGPSVEGTTSSRDSNSKKNCPPTLTHHQVIITPAKEVTPKAQSQATTKGCLKTGVSSNTKNGSEDTPSPLLRFPSLTLENNFQNITEPVVILQNKFTIQVQAEPLENVHLKTDGDDARNTTIKYKDKASTLPPSTSPSHSTQIANLEKNFAKLTPSEPHLIPDKGVNATVTDEITNLFCSLCQRTYLTKTTYDWHVARHKKCKECGVDLRQNSFLSRGFSKTLEKYCAPCAVKIKKALSVCFPRVSKSSDSKGPLKKIKVIRRPGRPRKIKTSEDYVYGVTKQVRGLRGSGPPPKIKFTCERCGMEFMQEKTFKVHKLQSRCQKVKDEGDSYVCKQCGKLCDSRKDLHHHMKIHRNMVSQCPVCSKWFQMDKHLASHMTSHYYSGEFPCKICEKKFGSITELKNHQTMSIACFQESLKLKEN